MAEADDGSIRGHLLLSEGELIGEDRAPRPVWLVGPVAVRPDRQHQGIGTALMHAVIRLAVSRGQPLLCLLGHPEYYARFGFEPARAIGIEPPHPWDDAHWMALRPPAWDGTWRGAVRCPPEFEE